MSYDPKVEVKWITPDAEQEIADLARISVPDGDGKEPTKLIRYCIRKGHWSVFEQASLSLRFERIPRDCSRHLIRHALKDHDLKPQEYSQRYADVMGLGEPIYRETRMQHPTNRQASLPCEDPVLDSWWQERQEEIWDKVSDAYVTALRNGMAKESARVILPEGLTPSRFALSGNIRDHLFCWHVRSGHGTQPETVQAAKLSWALMEQKMPTVCAAFTAEMGAPA